MSADANTLDAWAGMSDEDFLQATNSIPPYERSSDEGGFEAGDHGSEELGDDDQLDAGDEPANGLIEENVDTGAEVLEDPNAEGAENGTGSEDGGEAGEGAEAGRQEGGGEGSDPVDYKALYEQVMGPIKANGSTFKPASPDEAVRLMQMGANYTKKMQGMQPHLKLLRTLETKGLLQEDKINYLIDLSEKNPQAIQKLLHESKLEPLDLDASAAPTYQPGNHTISDAEMTFQDAITSVAETDNGKETIQHINSSWDQASKRQLYEDPALLSVIAKQRSNGIYAKISAEIERRRILGEIGNIPFVHAYKAVGDDLHAKGLLAAPKQAPASAAPGTVQTPPAVSTRPARPRTPAASRDQVHAVSSAPGRTARSPAPASFNPLTMTDEEVMAITSRRI